MPILVTALVAVAAGLIFGLLMSAGPLDPMRAVASGAGMAGFIVIAVALVRVWLQARFADTGVRAVGEVVDVVETFRGSRPDLAKYAVVVRFRTVDGAEVTADSGRRQSYFRNDIDRAIAADPATGLRRTGHHRVTVVYDPKRPSRFLLREPFPTGVFALLLQRMTGLLAGIVLIAAAIILVTR